MKRNKQHRFDHLVQSYYKDIYRYSYWLCGQKQMAEDVVQECFLRAWRGFDSLKDETVAKAWLITIARREHARLYARYQPQFVDMEQLDYQADPRAEQASQTFELRRAIDKLSAEYREPLVLQVIEGFSGDQIAEIMDLNSNTVATRLFRARQQLKQLYLADDDGKENERSSHE